jgi:hypothetical protein
MGAGGAEAASGLAAVASGMPPEADPSDWDRTPIGSSGTRFSRVMPCQHTQNPPHANKATPNLRRKKGRITGETIAIGCILKKFQEFTLILLKYFSRQLKYASA